MFSAGDIALAHVAGTELTQFSAKPQRYVLVAYDLGEDVFVYPLSSRKSAKGPHWRVSSEGYAIVERGLYRVPAAKLEQTSHRAALLPSLHDRIRQDLHAREIRALNDPGSLTQRAFSSLQELKSPDVAMPPLSLPKPEPKLSDEELFKKYIDRDFGPEK